MITRPKRLRCFACEQRPADREITLHGIRLPMCSVCPTPSEIRERAALVRSKWDAKEYDCRRLGCPREHVDYVLAIHMDDSHNICELVYPPKVASY